MQYTESSPRRCLQLPWAAGYCPTHLQCSPDAAEAPGAARRLPSCLRVIPQAGGRGDRRCAPLCRTDTDISHRRELFKQSLRNNQCFLYIISEHSSASKRRLPSSKTPGSATTPSAAGFPLPRQPQWTNKEELKSPGSHNRARNHRAYESWLLCFQLCGMLPRSPQSTRGICQVFGDLRRHPVRQGYPRATDLTACQEPWNQAWSLSEPIPCLWRKSLKLMLLQNILVSMNLPFLMETCFVREFPASSSL